MAEETSAGSEQMQRNINSIFFNLHVFGTPNIYWWSDFHLRHSLFTELIALLGVKGAVRGLEGTPLADCCVLTKLE
jgi:hypothetical protein